MHNPEHYANHTINHSEIWTPSTRSSGHFARVKLLFMYMYTLITKSSWKAGLLVHCLSEGVGLQPLLVPLPLHAHVVKDLKSLSICWYYFTNWGASCLNICNIVLYNNCLSIAAVIWIISLLKLRLEIVNFMQPEGAVTLGGPLLSSRFLTCVRLAFYEALFTFLLSVLP